MPPQGPQWRFIGRFFRFQLPAAQEQAVDGNPPPGHKAADTMA
jgi:hypothetical protein